MPKVIGKYKCSNCQDEFIATSEEDYTYCKCGTCGVKPTNYHSTNYKKGSYFKTLEFQIFYSSEDFIILNNEILELWNQIKELGSQLKYPLCFYKHEWYKENPNSEEKFIYDIEAEVYSYEHQEKNKLEIKIKLEKEYTRYKHCQTTEEVLFDIKKRMELFYKLLLKIKSGKLNIDNSKLLKRISPDWREKQQEIYDCMFEF